MRDLAQYGYPPLGNNLVLPIERKATHIAVFMFTSGSTGKPKPVIRTNLNLIYIAMSQQHPDLLGHKSDDIS
jgi:acyl-coenzyme A synthetase/AMP-(fatty) acid ligase